jgi:kynurenine formamidase
VTARDLTSHRWKLRPDGANWGDFGPDDQIGRLNLITPACRRAAAVEVREGLAFCLSLPLDCPRVQLNANRKPPAFDYALRGGQPAMHYPYGRLFPGVRQAVCDDAVTLYTQYSTQWDALCHIGFLYDAFGDGHEQVTYYNGFRAVDHVRGPIDYLDGDRALDGPYGAMRLGIDTLAETGVQGRGVMIDLHAHVGLERLGVGYDALMRILEADRVEVESGDILALRTGFDRVLLANHADPALPVDPRKCCGLDGFDDRLLKWIDDSGVAALVSDNDSIELSPDFSKPAVDGKVVPLHYLCLFQLGIPLGEYFLLSDLADWLRANRRSRFLFTAPPLRLPGAVGSPVTGVGTV